MVFHVDADLTTELEPGTKHFDRRKTMLPPDIPFGLTEGFAQDTHKQTQWQAFLGR